MKFEKVIKNILQKTSQEIKSHPKVYVLLTAVLIYAFWIRVYRNDQLMAFYYDQGRDALVIWKLWHEGKLFLIGPVTGLTGIFLGPFYYYLIAPFYLLGGGNPVVPAYLLALLTLSAIIIIYYLGMQIVDRRTGLIASVVSSFSFNLILSSRWLSNPTPIIFSSMVIILAMWKIVINAGKYWWVVLSLFVGISLHFESASAVFYLPIVFIFSLWQRKNLPSSKTILLSIFILFLTFLPQLLFNFRHDNILFNNFLAQFTGGEGFRLDFWKVFPLRLNYFLDVFGSKLLPQYNFIALFYFILSLLALVKFRMNLRNKKILGVLLIFFAVPLIGYIFYQGNHGNIYDYYLTGYFYPFTFLFSLGLGLLWKNIYGKIIVLIFMSGFLYRNIFLTKIYMSAGVDGPTHITLGNELRAVDWVFSDPEKSEQFNVDVYVPPVIPHSYDYLFLWQGYNRCGETLCGLVETSEEIVYVLYEVDPPHPERLESWLSKYADTSKIINKESFGGITIEKRIRI